MGRSIYGIRRGSKKGGLGVAALFLAGVLLAPCPSFAAGCVTSACHPALGAAKGGHEPVASGECLSCHKEQGKEHPGKEKGFKLSAQGKALCDTCHDGIGNGGTLHPPVKAGECLACHKVHGGKGRKLLDVDQDLFPLCTGCHEEEPFRKPFQHGPVAEGACLACHAPHQAQGKFLLKKGARELCLECHEDFAKGMQAAERVHPPVKEKPCTSCHDPHSGEFRFLLKKKMPELCLDCHQRVAKQLKDAKLVHKPVLDGKGCGNCHSTHFSKGKGLLAGVQKEICLNCHNNDATGTPPLRNIAKELAGEKKLHGPINKGRCDGCHDPHASDYRDMLTGKYPDTFYAPYSEGSYGLCLKCHEKNLLAFAETTMYTKFRNGDKNLHFVHVADRIKGRTCRACHETHSSAGAMLIAGEGARFGQWRVQARFQKSATGGSCAPGCHKSYRYDRDKPVKY